MTSAEPVSRRRRFAGLRDLRDIRDLRDLPALLKLLIGTQLAFNVGFSAVLPYLSVHLDQALGLAGWLVGLLLGLRTFSQQGLFVVGGALTDRYGPRPIVLVGCALRVAGFVGLAFAGEVWSVTASVLLIGFAAALFSPAVESEVARQAVRYERDGHLPRSRVLALFSVAGQIGAFTGPLLGALLLFVDFRAACLAGAVVFVAILAGHARLMPRHIPGRPLDSAPAATRTGLRLLAGNRPFLVLCLAYSGYLLAYNQLYLAIPHQLGSSGALAGLLALSSVLVIVGQLPVTRWVSQRLAPRTATRVGLLIVAAGFALVAATYPIRYALGVLPTAGLVVLLTVGQMLIVPSVRSWLPDLAEEHHLGLYTGALSSISGLVVLAGSSVTGLLLDSVGDTPIPWLLLAAVPVVCAAILGVTRQRAA
ncbi:MDR family MFS transporter [Micromonospora polyrhachis]|uniref:MFS family permease n=1 Tax=Micromonospora polyrhachis TaxID=1282883 RepID=A0A7W7SVS7_9ACTN|nr:MFS transporter [Micromonospora polyrhachis]MBB4961257.1 MFS family permease [Micromonospora polyrhachis]